VVATFAVIAEHPPELCPSSNAQTRQMMREGAPQIPQLAQQLGVDIVTLRVFGPDHIVLAVVEANDIEPVRDLMFESRLIHSRGRMAWRRSSNQLEKSSRRSSSVRAARQIGA
jgi:hypothetical protein